MFMSTNAYGWMLLAKRDGRDWNFEHAMAEAKRAGVRGWEHSYNTVDEVYLVADAAKRHGLEMYSGYINGGVYHEPELAQASIKQALEIATALQKVGVTYIIVNPHPVDGYPVDPPSVRPLKTEKQLATQLEAINYLGKASAGIGCSLLLHSHDSEMKAGSREFHHMLVNTNPEYVGLCLDVHWVYRGLENCQSGLHDIINLYASRIKVLHLRQSSGGVWTESIGPGDIDFEALTLHLSSHGVKALLTLELCLEKGTSAKLSGEQANADAVKYVEPLFGRIAVEPSEDLPVPWRIFLYGGGAIAQHHAKAARNIKDHVLYVADPSEVARNSFAKNFPRAKLFENARTMLDSTPSRQHDIVIIAVPPILHRSAAMDALDSGRHVLCEKPVTLSDAHLRELLEASRSKNLLFGDCSVRFLCNEALPRAREIIATGGIGDPYHARLVNCFPRTRPGIEFQPGSKWFLNKEIAGGGAIYDWAVYDLTMFFDVLRPVAAYIHTAWLATPKTAVDPMEPISVETHAGSSMTLELETGKKVVLDFERALGYHGERKSILTVAGSKGGLAWEWCPPFEGDKPRLKHWVDVEGKVFKREEEFATFGWADVHGRPLLAFVDLVAGRESAITSPARLEFNHNVLRAMYTSAIEGKPVVVKLKN